MLLSVTIVNQILIVRLFGARLEPTWPKNCRTTVTKTWPNNGSKTVTKTTGKTTQTGQTFLTKTYAKIDVLSR